MPAWRVDGQDRRVYHFDVGAMNGIAAEFVTHVVLCLAETPRIVNVNSRTLTTVHMGPPLEPLSQSVDVIGTALLDPEGIQSSERRKIKVFVDDRLGERKAQASRLARLQGLEKCCAEYVI